MLSIFFLSIAATAINCVHATPHEQISQPPQPWTILEAPNPSQQIELSIALALPQQRDLVQQLFDISTPDHQKYGHHLGAKEALQLLQPKTTSVNRTLTWLQTLGLSPSFDGHLIQFITNITTANRMFGANFTWYSTNSKEKTLRTLSYEIPSELQDEIDFVSPTVKFPSLANSMIITGSTYKAASIASSGSPSAMKSQANSKCNETLITPDCLRSFYKFPAITKAKPKSRLAIASFLGQRHVVKDISNFLNQFAPYANSSQIPIIDIPNPGHQNNSEGYIEANLDVAYAVSLAYPIPVVEYVTPGCGPLNPDPNVPEGSCKNEPYMEFLTELLKKPDTELPQVLSISYSEFEQTWPEKQAQRVCNMFAALGARGVSVLVASGDHGTGTVCLDNSGKEKKFLPTFPSTCPFVTSVGGTKSIEAETAVDFTGSGFSNLWPIPEYQKSAVKEYLATLKAAGDPVGAYYNHSGRGIPDISAQGVNFAVPDGDNVLSISGTSASTPVIAAIIALLNEKRASKGKPSMGFLNPWLYSVGSKGFNDVAIGQSSGCRIVEPIEDASWNATKGWDAATGLGTPDVSRLLHLV